MLSLKEKTKLYAKPAYVGIPVTIFFLSQLLYYFLSSPLKYPVHIDRRSGLIRSHLCQECSLSDKFREEEYGTKLYEQNSHCQRIYALPAHIVDIISVSVLQFPFIRTNYPFVRISYSGQRRHFLKMMRLPSIQFLLQSLSAMYFR
jgi:hypothetical protein